jgi:RNA-directed DNA polymerase
MKESYGEDLASHTDPESCAVARKGGREALIGACAGELLSREITMIRGADALPAGGRLHSVSRQGKRYGNLARSENLCMHRNTLRENREVPCPPVQHGRTGRVGKSKDVSQR